jgi:hypothetical protein
MTPCLQVIRLHWRQQAITTDVSEKLITPSSELNQGKLLQIDTVLDAATMTQLGTGTMEIQWEENRCAITERNASRPTINSLYRTNLSFNKFGVPAPRAQPEN